MCLGCTSCDAAVIAARCYGWCNVHVFAQQGRTRSSPLVLLPRAPVITHASSEVSTSPSLTPPIRYPFLLADLRPGALMWWLRVLRGPNHLVRGLVQPVHVWFDVLPGLLCVRLELSAYVLSSHSKAHCCAKAGQKISCLARSSSSSTTLAIDHAGNGRERGVCRGKQSHDGTMVPDGRAMVQGSVGKGRSGPTQGELGRARGVCVGGRGSRSRSRGCEPAEEWSAWPVHGATKLLPGGFGCAPDTGQATRDLDGQWLVTFGTTWRASCAATHGTRTWVLARMGGAQIPGLETTARWAWGQAPIR